MILSLLPLIFLGILWSLYLIFKPNRSGLSEGDFVTLGHNEKNDLRTLVEYLRNKDYISEYFLNRKTIEFMCIVSDYGEGVWEL